MVSDLFRMNERSGLDGMPICLVVRAVTAWSNHTPST